MIIRSRTGQTAKVLTKKKVLKNTCTIIPIFEHSCVLIWKLVQLIFTATTGSSVAAVLVSQSCPTLCDPMNCSPPGSSIHGILQARILEWIAIPFSRGSSWPRDQTQVSCTAGRFFTIWATGKILKHRTIPRFLTFLQWHSSIYISTSFCYSISVPTFKSQLQFIKVNTMN